MKKMFRVTVKFPHQKYAKKDYYHYYVVLAKSEDDAIAKVQKEFSHDISDYSFHAWECDDDVVFTNSEEH